MRKQYHSRKTKDGVATWDVHNLVELSKDLPVLDVPLENVKEMDQAYWFDESHYPTGREILVHFKLVSEADLSYPIILCNQGKLMDGMHRVVKAHLEGRKSIKAVRFEKIPEPDYLDIDLEDLPY